MTISRQSSNMNLKGLSVTERTRTVTEFNGRSITPQVIEPQTIIQKEEWLEAARRSTEHFKSHGSPVPLVWVLTEGNRIPDNAVPFGEDRNGYTLYIARALLEGSLHIGKASSKFSGAVISYAGKEHITNHYEVLVCASELRWGVARPEPEGVLSQGTVVLAQQQATKTAVKLKFRTAEVELFNTTLVESDIPRLIPGEIPDRDVGLRRLAEIKTVIIIDDSMSMADNLWEQAREALAGIVDIANQYGSKGADIHFMHWDDYAPNMLSKVEVQALFNQLSPEGEDTPTGKKLGEIIDHYLPLIEDERSTHEPITVVVITDGLPTDREKLERVIVDAAHRLDRHHVKHDRFRIQFVQIGTDPSASDLLHVLDDHLVNRYNIRDIVDSTPFDPAQGLFDTEYMLKILLGGLRQNGDGAGSTLLSPAGNTLRPSPRTLSAKLSSSNLRVASLSPRSTAY